MRHVAVIITLLWLLYTAADVVQSSLGDRAPSYQSCVAECAGRCDVNASLSAELLWTGWTCESDCAYHCSHAHHAQLVSSGQSVTKYHGKWAFLRVCGCQELISTVASLVNAAPHIYYGIKYARVVDRHYPLQPYWLWYAVVNVNTWIWSAVFHCRDVWWTERLDYYFASFGIANAVAITVIRLARFRLSIQRIMVMATLYALFLLHIAYMQFVKFDYGWNMTVSVAVGIAYIIMSLLWAYVDRARPHMWKLLVSTLYLMCVVPFELLDFPPVSLLLDAHASWHCLTPPCAALFWSFLLDDAHAEVQEEQYTIDKQV